MSPKVRAVYFKELRDAMRDRRTVFASLVVPLVLYPCMLLGVAEVSQLAKARMEKESYPVAIRPGSAALLEKIAKEAEAQSAESQGGAAALQMPALPGQEKIAPPKLIYKEMSEEQAKKE